MRLPARPLGAQLILADQPAGWLRHILCWALALMLATREKHVESAHDDTCDSDPDCETCQRFDTIGLWLRVLDDAEGEQAELNATEVAAESMVAFFDGINEDSKAGMPVVVTLSPHRAIDLRDVLRDQIRETERAISKATAEWGEEMVTEKTALPDALRRLNALYNQVDKAIHRQE